MKTFSRASSTYSFKNWLLNMECLVKFMWKQMSFSTEVFLCLKSPLFIIQQKTARLHSFHKTPQRTRAYKRGQNFLCMRIYTRVHFSPLPPRRYRINFWHVICRARVCEEKFNQDIGNPLAVKKDLLRSIVNFRKALLAFQYFHGPIAALTFPMVPQRLVK